MENAVISKPNQRKIIICSIISIWYWKCVLDARLAHSKFKNQSVFILLCVRCVNTSKKRRRKKFNIHNARTHTLLNRTHYQIIEMRRESERKSEMKFVIWKNGIPYVSNQMKILNDATNAPDFKSNERKTVRFR